MPSKQEKRIAQVVLILLLAYIIISAFCSCRSRKYLQSKVGLSETLVEKSESSTQTNFFDSIRQWLSVDADSITLTFSIPERGPENPTLPEETKSSPNLRMGEDLALGSFTPDNHVDIYSKFTFKSVAEEDIEQESVPNYPLRWLYCIAIAIIAISIFSVLHKRR